MRNFVLVVGAAVVAGGPAAAQVVQQVQPVPAQVGGVTYRAKELLGDRVLLAGGAAAGTIDDIVIGADGRVDYLVVENGGRLFTVPFEAATVDPRQRVATLTITPQQFRQVPTFAPQQYPNFYAPQYRETTYRFYGLTPGQVRRLDRQLDRRD